MTKFRVAYVDESDSDLRKFQRFSRNYFDVIPIKPYQNIEKTAAEILDNHVDAVIADFDLSEQDPLIHYNGANLVSLILQERDMFPVFILTSYEDDAVSKGEDVNIVYEKSEMADGEKFLERVKSQIEKYYHKLEEAEKQLIELIQKSKIGKLDALEEDEVKKLDSLIEKALDKKTPIPDNIRQGKEVKDLSELLRKVDELAKKLDIKNE
jgi:DNA-binding NarL/FixJ family response regulator